MKQITIIIAALLAASAFGRSYSFKIVGSGGKGGANDYLYFQDKSKHLVGELTIGRPGPKEDLAPLEIRAASVFKDINSKMAFINDIACATFSSTNSATSKVIIYSGAAGKVVDRDAKVNGGYDFSHGNTIAGIIVEIFQHGKCIKHLSNIPGKDGKKSLADGTLEALLNADDTYDFERRKRTAEEVAEYKADGFNNATKISIQK